MSRQNRNKEAVRQLIEGVYGGDLDRLHDLVAEDYMDHSRWNDRDGLRKMLAAFKSAYPDVRFTLKDIFAEGDRVAARFQCQCGGDEPENCHEKHFEAIAIFRLVNGRIVEHWGHSDSFF